MQEFYETNDANLGKAAMGFGGGIARRQSECGTLVGGVMALGLKHGRDVTLDKTPEAEAARQKVRDESSQLLSTFESTFGGTYCRSLTGHDFSQPDGNQQFRADREARARCREYAAFVVRTLTAQP